MPTTNIKTATTTEVIDREATLKRVVVNTAVANAVVTIYDNTSEGVGGADTNGISTSQTPVAAGNLTITGVLASGGVATLGYRRKVTITSAADETARTFTVTGTAPNGNAQTEEIVGLNNGTATGTKDFLTVTQIAVDDATTGAVEAGVAAAAGDTLLATITMPATLLQNHFTLEYDSQCRFGITVVTSSTADITVVAE